MSVKNHKNCTDAAAISRTIGSKKPEKSLPPMPPMPPMPKPSPINK